MKATSRTVYLELAKIAKQRGTMNDTLLRVYLTNMARAYRREQAAEATAASFMKYENQSS